VTLPAEWVQIPVTGTFLKRDGTPASGYVTFESQLPVSIGGVVVCPGVITA
jgi:hypothetical protein